MNFEDRKNILEFLRKNSDNNFFEPACEVLSNQNTAIFEYKSGIDLKTIREKSHNCIIFENGIIQSIFSDYNKLKSTDTFTNYLTDAARILIEKQPLILCSDNDFIVFIKEILPGRSINLRVIDHSRGDSLEPFLSALNFVRPINNPDYIDYLVSKGYKIIKNKDPKNDPARHLRTFKKFLEKGKEFASEEWLAEMDYQFIEPNTFTMGHRIAYKMINDFPDERFNSNFSIVKGEKEIPLYLKKELPKL